MSRTLRALLLIGVAGCRAAPGPVEVPALPEFRTVATAATTRIVRAAAAPSGQPGYLGLHVMDDAAGRVVVADVAADSPAARAGLRAGDVVLEFAGESVEDADGLRDAIPVRTPGESVTVRVEREGRSLDLAATLGSASRPMKSSDQRAIMGVQVGDSDGDGAPITRVNPGSPAERAGLKSGDAILEVDGAPLAAGERLADRLAGKNPGDTVSVTARREGKPQEFKVELAADTASSDGFFRGGSYWKKDLYRLAVVPVEYPDAKHNEKIATADWHEALFSRDTYHAKTNATGQPVHGSLNDYYREQSCGAFRVEGRVFDWVPASKNRADYAQGTGTGQKSVFLTEAVDRLLEREGKDALKDFDGLFFLYAGDRVQTSRGGLYWPHRGTFTYKGKRLSYFIVPEGGARMGSISTIAHEFGHMLGLPDLYARPENPGSEGLGAWCAMSDQNGGGMPQHLSAWCKEQLGWLQPAVVEPTVKQRLVLGPIEESSKECFKVLVRRDGSEYLLLENRRKKGFDQNLPAEGLLIWRIVRTRPLLEESHGVEGPSGPRVYLSAVPYPSAANDAFTPHTTPSSRSQLGGGLPVHITQIRRLPDGRISFYLGFDYE